MSAALPALPMCECCPEPGRCCRNFYLSTASGGGAFGYRMKEMGTAIHMLVEAAKQFLPFIPTEQLVEIETPDNPMGAREPFVVWTFNCPELRADGRCAIYEHRPQVCRDFAPGSSPLCVYHVGKREP